MDEKITSRENAKIKYACRLSSSAAFRRSEGRFLAEGRKLCPELCRGAELETLFYTASAAEKCPEILELPGEHFLVEDHVADKLATWAPIRGCSASSARLCIPWRKCTPAGGIWHWNGCRTRQCGHSAALGGGFRL